MMMSEPVTIRINEEPKSPFPYDWEIWVGDELILTGDDCFRYGARALADVLYKLRTLTEALKMGIRTKDGEPVDLDLSTIRWEDFPLD